MWCDGKNWLGYATGDVSYTPVSVRTRDLLATFIGKFLLQNFDVIRKDVDTQELHHHLYEEDTLVVPTDCPISCWILTNSFFFWLICSQCVSGCDAQWRTLFRTTIWDPTCVRGCSCSHYCFEGTRPHPTSPCTHTHIVTSKERNGFKPSWIASRASCRATVRVRHT
jgi:hypothetical protein